MFGGFGLTELLVILAIVLLIFGPKRIKGLGADLGTAIKGFRKAVTDDDKEPVPDAGVHTDSKVIEGELNENAAEAESQAKHNSNV